MNTATAPVWASETSKTDARGRTGMTLMVVNIAGLALSCWMTCRITSYTNHIPIDADGDQMPSASFALSSRGDSLLHSNFSSFSSSTSPLSGFRSHRVGLS